MPGRNGQYRLTRVTPATRRRAVGSVLARQPKLVRITAGQQANILRAAKSR